MSKKKSEVLPYWVAQAISASEDFHYGIEDKIEAIWNDGTLTKLQKQARIERAMVNARHEKWKDVR